MPKAYESMKKSFKKKGMSDKAAKKKAAKVYNSKRPKGAPPVSRKKH